MDALTAMKDAEKLLRSYNGEYSDRGIEIINNLSAAVQEVEQALKDAQSWREFQGKLKEATTIGSGFIAMKDTNLARL